MADLDTEKSSYGGFERFLFFVTPILFTAILVVVLLTLFNYDVKSVAYKLGNSIPILNQFVPDRVDSPKSDQAASESGGEPAAGTAQTAEAAQKYEQTIKDLTAKLKDQTSKLQQSEAAAEQKDAKIEELTNKAQQLNDQLYAKQVSDKKYSERVKELADLYGSMLPSKAAPIVESLTPSEQALVLSAMDEEQRTKLLEKMTPKAAADASIRMKDVVSDKDRQIAALQERLAQAEKSAGSNQASLAAADAAASIAGMTPASAAKLLLEMNRKNPAQVVTLLKSMSTAQRSQVLTAMTSESQADTAVIASKLTK